MREHLNRSNFMRATLLTVGLLGASLTSRWFRADAMSGQHLSRNCLAGQENAYLSIREYIKLAEEMLNQRGFNMQEMTARELIDEKGYEVGDFVTYQEPRELITGKEGVEVILNIPVSDTPALRVSEGARFLRVAQVKLRNKSTNKEDKYELVCSPYTVSIPRENADGIIPEQIITTNKVTNISPSYIRLEG